jgi:type II secretory pathway component GspD/PulD (secretin)
VTVPDRGTLLITGFKDLLMRDMHSGVPFLEHIPVLNFFFTRKAKADERRRLMMLVTPEIIDLAEHEDQQF